jgi:site-specific recombinase XerD
MLHLFDCRYASNTIDNYLAGLTHFAHWLTQSNIEVKSFNLISKILQPGPSIKSLDGVY